MVRPVFVIVEPASNANGASAAPSGMAEPPWLHDKVAGGGVARTPGGITPLPAALNGGTVQFPHRPPPLRETRNARVSSAASRRIIASLPGRYRTSKSRNAGYTPRRNLNSQDS